MDFYKIVTERTNDNRAKQDYIIYPDFSYKRVTDLIVKGGVFYAFWNGSSWIMDIDDLIDQIDRESWQEYERLKAADDSLRIAVKSMNLESSGLMTRFQNYCKKQKTSSAQFNKVVLFNDHVVEKKDYSTYQLPYSPSEGNVEAFHELMNVLYEPKELQKILWCMGALFTGKIAKIEKFLYLYGAKGTGKGTVINIIKMLMGDYWRGIDLQFLTGTSEFATSGVEEVPMLIDSDTDLSKIKKDINLLKLTSHEELLKRMLYQTPYPVTFRGLLVTASNERYTMKSKDSGMVRRPIVVHPSGNIVNFTDYHRLMNKIEFEIPAIANLAMNVFTDMGSAYYEDEVDVDMIAYSDKVFDFIRENYITMEKGITLKRAAGLYAEYLRDMGWDDKAAKRELKNSLDKYFDVYKKDTRDDAGNRMYDWYSGFRYDVAFPEGGTTEYVSPTSSVLELDISQTTAGSFDTDASDWPAQYTKADGTPINKWDNVKTKLSDLDITKLHYVRVPLEHIVIDFDIKDPKTGEKDYDLNLKAASKYPTTYTELSKSGGGIHLHYYYDGDVSKLANHIAEDIEVKVYTGNSSLRRKFSKCNNKEITHISSGLPFKEEDKRVFKDVENIAWTESKLKGFIEAALNKEHHGATKPEIDFIYKVLEEAKHADVQYDLNSIKQKVLLFAMRSKNQKTYCIDMVGKMTFATIETEEDLSSNSNSQIIPDDQIYMLDVEVFSNLLIVAWKIHGLDVPEPIFAGNPSRSEKILNDAWWKEHENKAAIWYNPSPDQIAWLINKPFVGYNNRRYDNHILYNRYLGADNINLYQQSQGIINKVSSVMMQPAYGLSYADLYEMMDIKQSLKKWEIDMGILHDELEFPWDQPLAKSNWLRAGQYCMRDVLATEYLWDSKQGKDAYTARKILAELTGLSINSKTQTLAEAFMFGNDPRPQDKFVWYDLAEEFPGYTFSYGKSDYKGENPSEGGYVHAEPGVYRNVMLADVESLHPHSAIAINYFGPYTPKFKALVDCRMHIKHKRFKEAMHAFDSIDPVMSAKLKPYLEDESQAGGLGHAMKIVINIVYGMTSAPYDNKFKAPSNIDNIIAKRGALFMMQTKRELEEMGQQVIHVKTDSLKLPEADEKIFEYIQERAHAFGYNFDHEATFGKLALVNKAVIIGQISYPTKNKGHWEPIGAQFRMPYVYKKLFSGEDVEEKDFAILKSAQSSIYLGERFIGKNAQVYASVTGEDVFRTGEVDIAKRCETRWLKMMDPEKAAQQIGIPVEDYNRIVDGGFKPEMMTTYNSVTGTKGFKWRLWSEYKGIDDIDVGYYDGLIEDAVNNIYKVGDGNILFEDTRYAREDIKLNVIETKDIAMA